MLETHGGAQVFKAERAQALSRVTPGSLAATAAGRWRWLVAGTPMVASGATSRVGVDGRRSRHERGQDRENSDDPLEPRHLITPFQYRRAGMDPWPVRPSHAASPVPPALTVNPSLDLRSGITSISLKGAR